MIWIGNQFKQAIGLYFQRSPGAVKRYPEKLEDLLEGKRYLSIQRYLRKICPDPISGKPAWGLVTASAAASWASTALPKENRSAQLVRDDKSAPSALSYRDWRFVYEPPAPAQAPSAKPAPRS